LRREIAFHVVNVADTLSFEAMGADQQSKAEETWQYQRRKPFRGQKAGHFKTYLQLLVAVRQSIHHMCRFRYLAVTFMTYGVLMLTNHAAKPQKLVLHAKN